MTEEQKEKRREYSREWKKNNPEKVRESQANYHKKKKKKVEDKLGWCAAEAQKLGITYGQYISSTTEAERKAGFENYMKSSGKKIKEKKVKTTTLEQEIKEQQEFGKRLREKMLDENITVNEMAARTGIYYKQIWEYRAGKMPVEEKLVLLARELGVTTEWMLTGA